MAQTPNEADKVMRVLGIDPGLRSSGWGIIDCSQEGKAVYIDSGLVAVGPKLPLSERLRQLYEGLEQVIVRYNPSHAAVEQSFINCNPRSSLKLGLACGVALLAPARTGIATTEYPANLVKQAVSGSGHASKRQVREAICLLLPGLPKSATELSDTADALAVAVCHLHRLTARSGSGYNLSCILKW